MVWAMDLDDFNGGCGFGNNPLMTKLKDVLMNPNVITQYPTLPPSPTPSVTQTSVSQTQASTQHPTATIGGKIKYRSYLQVRR